MLEIKHTLCPSCSVGCGINVVLDDGEIVGTFPYKRHPINEGKNCLNGRNSIDSYTNRFDESMILNSEKAIDEIAKELKSADPSEVTVIASGNNSIEEIESIKDFADSNNFNIGFYADNLKNFDDVASYDDVENASKIFVIGDLLYGNPLIGRRLVHAKNNGAEIYAVDSSENVTSAIASEFSVKPVIEFLDENKSNIDDSSVIIFNRIDESSDLAKIEEIISNTQCKVLPVFSKSNSKGVLSLIDAKSKEEMDELLDSTKVLLVFNDDIVEDYDFDFSRISKIISFSPCANKTTEMSNIVVPIKTWLEQDGSFVNSMGQTQTFAKIIDSDVLGEVDVIEKLKNN
jgi:formate dehydrogenase major subunit